MPRKPSERKVTSKKEATRASKVLRNPKSSKAARSLAGSDLAQARGKKGK